MAKSNFEKGIEYEQLTKDVVEKYLNDIRLDGTVKWNVTLDGKSGATHQIDVLVSHKNGKVSIIECKNYGSNITQEKIQSFITVRDDLKDHKIVDAYFFTKTGFQTGAEKIAKAYDIKIKNLKEYDRNEDYATGRIKSIKATLGMYVKTKFEYHIYDKNKKELTGAFFTDGLESYHRSELYNYFGLKEGLRITKEGNYKNTFLELSKYNMKDCLTGEIIDSFSYDVIYKKETEKLFEINDNLTKQVIIDKENNKIQFLDEQLGLIEKKLK